MPQIKATAKLVDNVRSIVDNAKQHSIVLDLPEAKGGKNTGPTALELAVMALADCALHWQSLCIPRQREWRTCRATIHVRGISRTPIRSLATQSPASVEHT